MIELLDCCVVNDFSGNGGEGSLTGCARIRLNGEEFHAECVQRSSVEAGVRAVHGALKKACPSFPDIIDIRFDPWGEGGGHLSFKMGERDINKFCDERTDDTQNAVLAFCKSIDSLL